MAWRDTLLNASFKGIEFDIERVDDSQQRSVALHEYPYRDGADVEDLGTGPNRLRFSAIIFNNDPEQDDYEQRLEVLLAALRSAEPGELVHPVFGSMQAICTQWSVGHEVDLRDGCKLVLEFVQAGTALRVFESPSPVLAAERITALGDSARAAADVALIDLVEDVRGGPVQRTLLLKASMNSALAQMRVLSDSTALTVLVSELDPIFYPQAYVTDARAVLERGLQGLPFGGRNLLFTTGQAVAGSGLADFDRAAKSLAPSAIALPAPNADGLLVQAHARVHTACSLAEAAAIVLAAELGEALLDRADVERLANTARSALQAALENMRAATVGGNSAEVGAAMRALAYQVQAAATAVIEQRPPVVLRVVPLTGPLRLVAHALYGDHTRAGELVRLNRFGRELVASAGQELKAYAL